MMKLKNLHKHQEKCSQQQGKFIRTRLIHTYNKLDITTPNFMLKNWAHNKLGKYKNENPMK